MMMFTMMLIMVTNVRIMQDLIAQFPNAATILPAATDALRRMKPGCKSPLPMVPGDANTWDDPWVWRLANRGSGCHSGTASGGSCSTVARRLTTSWGDRGCAGACCCGVGTCVEMHTMVCMKHTRTLPAACVAPAWRLPLAGSTHDPPSVPLPVPATQILAWLQAYAHAARAAVEMG